MFFILKKGITLGLAVALLGWMTSPALAKEGGAGNFQLETMEVSAQKRTENVQEVPISVDVIDEVALEEAGIRQFLELNRVVPNLTISSSGGATTYSYVGIRGRISSGTDVDPTVTLLVDGIPYDDYGSLGANLLFDIERIEVLRGPQNTMYGLSSAAGVINIITKKPGDTLRIRANAEVGGGSEYGAAGLVSGSVSGPLVQGVLAGGLSFMALGDQGYVKNVYTGDTYNSTNNMAGRGSLVWTPTDAWEVTLGLSHTDYESDYGMLNLPLNGSAAASLGQNYLGDWEQDLDWDGSGSVKTTGASLHAQYEAGPVTVVSATAFRDTSQEFDADYDLTRLPLMYGFFSNDSQSFSQELRLQSPDGEDSPLQWLVGFFHNSFNRDVALGVAGNPYERTAMVNSELKGASNSVFGQGTYRFWERKLGLTLGVRQEWTNRELHDKMGALPDLDKTDSQFLSKFAVDYRFSPLVMAYASLTQGWRSGGYFNMSSFTTDPEMVKFEKETSWTYELGAKTQFLGGRLLVNAALFHTIYDDFQDKVMTSSLQSYLMNAGEVHMSGFELESKAHLSDCLVLTASVGYVHGEYKDFTDSKGDYSGNTVISVPDFDLNLALKYSFLDGFYVRPEVQGTGEIFWDHANTASQDPYYQLNCRVGYIKDQWEIYAYGKNLTNEYSFVHAFDMFGNGEWFGTPITPLMVGIGISWNF
ncbi:TonB-dependent receptor [Dethiosulfatarculus sandiegensis]|uniref:TonB-denpendent receptor n=1 Tax=Dethiosulfatarculus sandiegensis TaxID=1429043 RepID=A0A0D2IYH0_9BACT|nr:TonB-dependent receptor [Dethiosulfatarculus sandiegensis]KIX11044.1 hypothetical protein X474_27550 [Dethiosulfatarculus sandiegensis]